MDATAKINVTEEQPIMTVKPRLFRSRRGHSPELVATVKGDALTIGRKPLPSVEAFVAQHRGRFPAGEVTELAVEHDADCRYPRGFPCSCVLGPEIRVVGDEPGNN